MRPGITVILGIPGAGKSTYSKTLVPAPALDAVRINLDDLRLCFGTAHDEKIEPFVWELALSMCDKAVARGYRVVLDESVTDPRDMRRIAEIARLRRTRLHGVYVMSPSYLCWKKREKCGFPRAAFERKFSEWEQNRDAILAMCDTLEVRPGNKDMLREISGTDF